MAITDPTDISNCVLWIQARDKSTLFQDIAGSTPVTGDSQTVGTANDKSGNAFHLTAAADDTTRPTFNESGGVEWITFDGSNDILRRTADLGLYAAGAASIFTAVRGNPASDARLICSGNSGNNSPLYCFQASNTGISGTPQHLAGFIRDNAGSSIYTASGNARDVLADTGVFDNTDNVVGWVDNGSSITGWLNGTEGAAQAYTRSGTVTLDRFSLGALLRAAAVSFFSALVYEVAIYTKALSDTEAADLSTYLAQAFVPPPAGGAIVPAKTQGGMMALTGGMSMMARKRGLLEVRPCG